MKRNLRAALKLARALGTSDPGSRERLFDEAVDRLPRKLVLELGGRLFDEVVERFPRPVAYELAARVEAPARMDYEGAEIMLRQSSPKIKVRLRSAAKEPFTVAWIESFESGDVFYDAGANVGAYSLIAAKSSGNTVRTFAFEPSAPSYHDLCLNVVLNRCAESVTPLAFALWSETALIPFAHFSLDPGSSQHVFGFRPGDGDRELLFAQQQPAISIDDAVSVLGLPPPAHVKLDTEGAELEVLAGARTTLSSPAWRSLLVEFDSAEDAAIQPPAVEEVIGPHGFELRDTYRREAATAAYYHLYVRGGIEKPASK